MTGPTPIIVDFLKPVFGNFIGRSISMLTRLCCCLSIVEFKKEYNESIDFWCTKKPGTLATEIEERFPRCLLPDELKENNDFLIKKRMSL
jgi:hypothetical protein